MTSVDLSTATFPDGTASYSGGVITAVSGSWHYFHLPTIPAMSFSAYYLIEIDFTGGASADSTRFNLYSQLSPDLDGYNNSWWATLADDVPTGDGSGTLSIVIGSGEQQWANAVSENEPYLIFEWWDNTPFTLSITGVRYSETGKPPPPEVIMVASGTYDPGLLAWNGERSYLCIWGGSNNPRFKMQISEDWKTVTKGPHTEAFLVFDGGNSEVQDDIVTYRYRPNFSGSTVNNYVRTMNLDNDPLAFIDQRIFPVNPTMVGNPQVRSMMTAYLGGEVYLLSRTSVSPYTMECWKATVDVEGNISAFTSLGNVTFPLPGAFPGGGTAYHSVNADPGPAQVSENIWYMGQNRGIWDKNNPLVIKEAYGYAGTANGMDSLYDSQDTGMGVESGMYLDYPGHILLHQRNQSAINSTLRGQLVDVQIDGAGDVVTRRYFQPPDTYYPAGSTWAKMPDGTIDAVCAVREASLWRIFYNCFDNPTEWVFPPGFPAVSNILSMGPSERAGFVFALTGPLANYFVSVQFGGDMGRLKVWTGTEWKYASPNPGENDGAGRLRVWNGTIWAAVDGEEEP